MKTLIYGIDGGDLEVISKFNMPFLREYIKNNCTLDVKCDLYNRGWVEILTGRQGVDTGGFYMSPVLDGTHKLSITFRMQQLKSLDIKPLWELFEENNLSYLIMNVPTTTPAPTNVNGVIIGSGGGGLNEIDGIPDNLVSHPSLKQLLLDYEYIPDIRIPTNKYNLTIDLIKDLLKMEQIRTRFFIEYTLRNDLDIGFLCNRGTTIIEYLCRSAIEVFDLSPSERKNQGFTQTDEWIFQALDEHFYEVDCMIKDMYTQLNPDSFIITSDHGIKPHKYRVNTEYFLIENNFMKLNSQKKKAKLRAKNILKGSRFLRPLLIRAKNLFSSKNKNLFSYIDWNETKAFGSTYVPGLFINDRERFNGPVLPKDVDIVINKIINTFNSLDHDQRLGLVAVKYRAHHEGRFNDKLPDIKFEKSEAIFFDNSLDSFVVHNKNYGPIPTSLSNVKHAAFTGDKSESPLNIVSANLSPYINNNETYDLTFIYDLIKKSINA